MTERWFPDGMPPPAADMDTGPWWEAAAEHRLTAQRCTSCQRLRHPPAPICAACRSTAFDWKELSGKGHVYTYTIVHRPVTRDQAVPFIVIAVELEDADGLRMVSNLVDAPPESVTIGMPVELVWEDMSDELAVPRFRAAPDGSS